VKKGISISSLDMSAKTVCVATFLLVMGITLVIPSFPPAQFLYELLKIPQNTMSIFGVSITVVLNGITNGFFWVVIGATAYAVSGRFSKSEPLPPLPEAPHLKTPPPEPMLVDQRINKIPPAFTVRKVAKPRLVTVRKVPKPRLEYEIEMIEGIGPIRSELLRNSGIKTVDDLLRVGASNLARHQLAKEVGVTDGILLKWINRGDLLRVRGVGRQYSELLESAGVISASDLSTRNPNYLHQTLKGVNREKNLVKRVPPADTIRIWVNNAKNLEPIMEHGT
jgi:predicted flap endonuclease-1-like 5' DNA nuclease